MAQVDPRSSALAARGIPAAAVARLPRYHQALSALLANGTTTASSAQIAELIGGTGANVRKDLSYLCLPGVRGVGYDVEYLHFRIAAELGLARRRGVAIVGMGHLGRALASYSGFLQRGFEVAALFDSSPDVYGRAPGRFDNQTIRPMSELEPVLAREGIRIAVVATPAGAAQAVVDRLVAAGVVSVLNFAPVAVQVPEQVQVRQVDLGAELQILAFHEHRSDPGPLLGALPQGARQAMAGAGR